MWPRFSLRTLFIAITLIAALLSCALYQLNLLDRKGEVVLNRNCGWDIEDPAAFGQEFKRRMAGLPNHISSATPLFPISDCPPSMRMSQRGEAIEQLFYKVQLSDGSSCKVGFWVFKDDHHSQTRTEISMVLLATDSFIERSAGAHRKRNEERHRLEETYVKIQDDVRNDYRAAHRKPHRAEALSSEKH